VLYAAETALLNKTGDFGFYVLVAMKVHFSTVRVENQVDSKTQGYLFDLLFEPEDGNSMFFRKVSELLLNYTVSHTR
jgi:hypothetical protein